MTQYSLVITNDEQIVLSVQGSVYLASYAAKTADLDSEVTYSVSLSKVLADGVSQGIASLTADGDTLATVLKAKLAKERKSEKAADTTADAAE